MEVIHSRCAGLDVHKDTVVACARRAKGREVKRDLGRFRTTTSGLLQLVSWLHERSGIRIASLIKKPRPTADKAPRTGATPRQHIAKKMLPSGPHLSLCIASGC